MKKLIIASLLFASCQVFAQQTERIVCATATWDGLDFAEVKALLADGWTVKHQSVVGESVSTAFIVFTLIAPSPEVLAKAQEDKRRIAAEVAAAAYAKRKAEYEKSKQVEK